MNEKKTEIADLLGILSKSGLSVASLEELAIPGHDWSIAKKILGKFWTDCRNAELQSKILRVRRLIALQEGGKSFTVAQKIVADDEDDNRKVCEALSSAGIQISNVYELVNTTNWYNDAISVLVELLPSVNSLRIKEGIVRALSIKGIDAEATKLLIREYELYDTSADNASIKWALANAISITVEHGLAEDLVQLIKNKKHGKSRGILLTAFERVKYDKVVDFLITALEDDDLAVYSIATLGKLRASEALPYLERYLTHPEARVRKEAQKAVSKISN